MPCTVLSHRAVAPCQAKVRSLGQEPPLGNVTPENSGQIKTGIAIWSFASGSFGQRF